MSPRTQKTILIVNTVLCVIAIPVSFGVQIAAVMGGASAPKELQALGTLIAMLGMGAIAMPPLSLIGSWATMKWWKSRWPSSPCRGSTRRSS